MYAQQPLFRTDAREDWRYNERREQHADPRTKCQAPAHFRKDNGPAIRKVCAQFVAVCREIGLLTKASVAIDGSKFKAVTNRDKNFTRAKMERRLAQIAESVARYLSQLDSADLQEPTISLITFDGDERARPGRRRLLRAGR